MRIYAGLFPLVLVSVWHSGSLSDIPYCEKRGSLVLP
jgi:hypothetical protein